MPHKHHFNRYMGTGAQDAVLAEKARQFLLNLNSLEFQVTGKHLTRTHAPKTDVTAMTARRGAGELWLKMFSDYEGNECLLFPFRTAADPRGAVTFNFKRMPAHRAMCLKTNGLPPEGKNWALHRCGNGHLGCVTPKHLYWGDASDNAKDAHRHRVDGKVEIIPQKTYLDHRLRRKQLKRMKALQAARMAQQEAS